MSKVKIIYSLFGICTLIAVLFFGFATLRQKAQLASGEEFSRTISEIILGNYSADYFISVSASPLLNNLDRRGMEIMLNSFRRVGELQTMGEARGELINSSWLPSEEPLVARYYISAEFITGPADIYAELIREAGAWKLLNFYIESPLLVE